MNGFQTYQIYNSLKLHFTTDYNAVKYNFKTAVRQDTFERRRDRYFFEKLSRRYSREQLIGYFTANLLYDSNIWIGDMKDEVYNDYVARHDKLTYMFTQDLSLMAAKGYTFDDLCSISSDNTNPLLEALKAEEIHPETVTLVDIMVNFLNRLKSELNDPLGVHTEQIDHLISYKYILMQRPLPRNKLKEKALLTFTNQPKCGSIDSAKTK